jgi:hypothetical protein
VAISVSVGCALDVDDAATSIDDHALVAANKLAANKLAANKLAANKLAANKLAANSLQSQQLMSTADGREVMSYVVGCALPTGQNLTLQDLQGVSYTYPGWIGLAPAWTTRVPTVAERRWVTACLLARTNLYGVTVSISMRSDTNNALSWTGDEAQYYKSIEGAFYGDLFATTPALFACAAKDFAKTTNQGIESTRACTHSTGGPTTACGFTYTSWCGNAVDDLPPACTDKSAPYGGCVGGGTTYSQVITINLQAP